MAGGTAPARLFINETDGALAFTEGDAAGLTGVTGCLSDRYRQRRAGRSGRAAGRREPAFARRRRLRLCDAPMRPGALTAATPGPPRFSATWEPGAIWPTLAIGNYVDRSDPDGPFFACDANELHRPQPGPHPTAQSTRWSPAFCALSALFSDSMARAGPSSASPTTGTTMCAAAMSSSGISSPCANAWADGLLGAGVDLGHGHRQP